MTLNKCILDWFALNAIFASILSGCSHAVIDTATNKIQDCPNCPVLRRIPAGQFVPLPATAAPLSSSTNNDAANTNRIVHIATPFLLGQYEITLKQYTEFVTNTRRAEPNKCFVFTGVNDKGETRFSWVMAANFKNPGYAQSDNSPAVCISWNDAVAYAEWLSNKTGKHYRLPTEAEFEYATRAGTNSSYYWGDDAAQVCRYANAADQSLKRAQSNFTDVADCDDGYVYTAPVGSYQPNTFGLYDMIGNAWEWTADCPHTDADVLPSDGSAYTQDNCEQHVRRSASWFRLGSVQRSALPNADWHGNAGFRVARDE